MPVVSLTAAAVPELPPGTPETGSMVDDFRGHRVYSLADVRDLLADEEAAKNVPRQTGGHTRVMGRDGTVRSEVYGLLLTHCGNRGRFLEVMDFEKCKGSREVAVLRLGGRREALVMRTSLLGQCDGTLEKWWAEFAAAAEKGKDAVKEFASVGPMTVETPSLRAVLSLEEWEHHGYADIGASMSPEFWAVIKEEVFLWRNYPPLPPPSADSSVGSWTRDGPTRPRSRHATRDHPSVISTPSSAFPARRPSSGRSRIAAAAVI